MSGGLRASDADRDKVAEVLHTAFAEGRLDTEEHSERLEAAIRAKTFEDLFPLTADLVPVSPVGQSDPTPVRTGEPRTRELYNRDAPDSDETDRMTAALSEVKRAGKWRMRRRSNANVFLGSVQLDLTEATFDTSVVEVNIMQVMGSVFLRVPLGVTIRDELATVLGETTVKGIGEPEAGMPTIVLKGTNVLGEIKVRGPKRPLHWKRAIA